MRGRLLGIKLALGAIFIYGTGWWLAPCFAGRHVPSAIWLKIGSIELYWYGLLIAVAVLVGIGLVRWLNQRFLRLNPDAVFYITVAAVFSAFIGARLLFVILEWPFYAKHLAEIWQIHSGGLSIHGALLGGLLAVIIGSRLARLNSWHLADLLAVALPLGQAIGRFGNFFNQEAFGGPTDLPWKMYVAPEFRPVGLEQFSFFHPAFLYEAVGDLIIFWLLWRLFTSRSSRPAGTVTLWYLLLYSGWRWCVEWFRIDSQQWGWLTLAQWGSLLIIIVAGWLLFYRYRLWKSR